MSTRVVTCACVVAVGGCSAVNALAETRRAASVLARVEALHSTPAVVYSVTLSRAYLDKAREEAAEAQYGNAVAYAQAATRAAEDAQRAQAEHVGRTFVSGSQGEPHKGEGQR